MPILTCGRCWLRMTVRWFTPETLRQSHASGTSSATRSRSCARRPGATRSPLANVVGPRLHAPAHDGPSALYHRTVRGVGVVTCQQRENPSEGLVSQTRLRRRGRGKPAPPEIARRVERTKRAGSLRLSVVRLGRTTQQTTPKELADLLHEEGRRKGALAWRESGEKRLGRVGNCAGSGRLVGACARGGAHGARAWRQVLESGVRGASCLAYLRAAAAPGRSMAEAAPAWGAAREADAASAARDAARGMAWAWVRARRALPRRVEICEAVSFSAWVGPGPPPWAVPCHRVARGPGGLRVAQRPERSDRLPAHTHDVGPPLAAAKRLSHLSWQAPNHCSSMSRGAACRAARHGPRQAPCASGGGGSSRGRGSREGHLVPDPRGYALPRPVFRLSDPGRVTCEPVTH